MNAMRSAAIYLNGSGYRTSVLTKAVSRLVRKLYEKGVSVKVFGGTSAGGLMAACYAQASTDLGLLNHYCRVVEDMWERIDRNGPEKIIPLGSSNVAKSVQSWLPTTGNTAIKLGLSEHLVPIESLYGLFDGTLLGTPEQPLHPTDSRKIARSPVRLEIFYEKTQMDKQGVSSHGVSVTLNHDERVQKNPAIIRDAVVASAALPGIFPAVEVDGSLCQDFGVLDPRLSVGREIDFIFVLVPAFYHIRNKEKETKLERMLFDSAIFRLIGTDSRKKGMLNDILFEDARRQIEDAQGKIRTLSWPGVQKIYRFTLGGHTESLHFHTFRPNDLVQAATLGDEQMLQELARLEEERFFD